MFLEFHLPKPWVLSKGFVCAIVRLSQFTEPLRNQWEGRLHPGRKTDVGRQRKTMHYETVVTEARILGKHRRY